MALDHPLDICVNTQTPLLQFSVPEHGGVAPAEMEDISHLVEGVDYQYSPGGVTRMVQPLLRRLRHDGLIRDTVWVSLNPLAPRTVQMPDLTLENVAIAPERLAAYGNVKETIWGTVHGLRDADGSDNLFWSDDYSEYAYYNRLTAEKIRSLDAKQDFDLFYIHDFQQLPIGGMLDTLKPKLFRWHIPFEAATIPERWRPAMMGYLDGYDAVVVSTDRYLRELKKFGFKGKAVKVYPYVDPAEYTTPTAAEVRAVVAQYGVEENDRILLVVGRMDPMKGQDHAVRALAKLAERYPRAKLLLVGNGSFSGSKGGLGLSKSGTWRQRLENLAKELGLEGRVLFAGHVSQQQLDACYERCELTVLPSILEGFGLVVVESWIHGRPVVVSSRAGIAELVKHEKNGLVVDPVEEDALAEQIGALLADPQGLGKRLIRGGRTALKKCTIDAAAKSESLLIGEVVEG
jgi:glycosyltransferase involved in cell wall biosynthesis